MDNEEPFQSIVKYEEVEISYDLANENDCIKVKMEHSLNRNLFANFEDATDAINNENHINILTQDEKGFLKRELKEELEIPDELTNNEIPFFTCDVKVEDCHKEDIEGEVPNEVMQGTDNVKQEKINLKDVTLVDLPTNVNGDIFFADSSTSINLTNSQMSNKWLRCKICNFTTIYRSNLNKHMDTHVKEELFSCKKATKRHTAVQPFSCSQCNFMCSLKRNLITHMRSHTRYTSFACNLCEYKTTRKSSLKRHMGLHTGDKPYKCHLCDYKSLQKESLTVHIRKHTGDKPFFCSVCTSRFSQKGNLLKHMKVHSGVKPFVCNECSFKSVSKFDLTRHMVTHTSDKPFACELCGWSFTQRYSLTKHMKTHENKEEEKPITANV